MENPNYNPFSAIDTRLKSIEDQLIEIANRERPIQNEKKFYRVSEAAQKLGVAPITIYRGTESGKIPAKRVGARVMIHSSFVDR